jgi:hypothetical protein
MKGIQKLFNRNKNLTSTGYCNVCQDIIEEISKKSSENLKKNFNFEKVEIDLEMMIQTHKKLINGSPVDPKTMNTLLLGGIVNIRHQSEAFEVVEARAKALEVVPPTRLE